MSDYAKAIYLADRNPRLSHAEFAERWLEHNRVTTGLCGRVMRRETASVRYCLADHSSALVPGASAEHDGVALFGLSGSYAIPAFADVVKRTDSTYADELRTFSRPVNDFIIYTSGEVVVAGPETGAVVLHFVRRGSDDLPSAFVNAWRDAHHEKSSGPVILGGRLRRCVLNLLTSPAPQGFGYDGVAEYWFDGVDEVADTADQLREVLDAAGAAVDQGASLLLVACVILAAGPTYAET